MPAERVTASHPTGPLPDNPMRVGFGASSPIRRVVSHRLQSAASGRSRDRDVTARNQDFCVVRVSMFFLI